MKKLLLSGLLIAGLCGCQTTTGEDATVQDVEDAVEQETSEGQASGQINAGSLAGTLDEPVTANNEVTYTLKEVNYSETNDMETVVADENNVFVYFTVEIMNDSDKVYSYSPDAFKLILPNATEESVKSEVAEGVEDALASGDLEAGESVTGVLSFEAPAEGTLTLAVYGDHLLDEEPLVTWVINR